MSPDHTDPADPPVSRVDLPPEPLRTLKTDTLLSGVSAAIQVKSRVLSRPGQPPESACDFELIDRVGQGGMGEVFSARQVSMDRVVAVKLLKPDLQRNESARLLFLSEATITGKLDHPNIIPVHELGRAGDGTLFYAMKYARGVFWHQVIRQKTLAENLDILLRVADAIAFAHAHFIVHRDIKPQNILVGDFGEVLVMDWGVALSVRPGANQVETGTRDARCGTPAYMAPEMAQGLRERVCAASDIYLLGAVLYEIIAGQPPHAGKDLGTALKNAERNRFAPLPRQDELARIALKALETEPADRYASVKDFQAALLAFREHQESANLVESADQRLEAAQTSRDYGDYHEALFGYRQALRIWPDNSAARTGLKEATRQYARAAVARGDLELALTLLDENDEKQRETARDIEQQLKTRHLHAARERALRRALATLGSGALVMFLLGAFWINRERLRAQRGEQRAETALLESRQQLSKSLEAAAGNAMEKERNAEALALLAASLRQDPSNLVAAARALDLLNRLNWALPVRAPSRAALPDRRVFPAVPPESYPKRTVLVKQVGQRDVLLQVADTNRVPLDEPAIGPVESRHTAPREATISPDGRFVAFGSGARRLHLFDRYTGKEIRPAVPHYPLWSETFCFSPDARCLLRANALGTVTFSAVEDTHTVRQDLHMGPDLAAAAFLEDRRRLAVATDKQLRAHIVELRPGQARARVFDAGSWINEGCLSPDGLRLGLTTRAAQTLVWSLATDALEDLPIRHERSAWALTFSPDGRRLALGSREGELMLWDLEARQELGYLPPANVPISHLVYDPRGGFLYSADHDRVRKWAADSLALVDSVTASQPIKSLAVSPDGQWLLVGCIQGAWLYSTKTMQAKPRPLLSASGWVRAVDFSPDGRLMLAAGAHRCAVFEVETGERLAEVGGHPDSIWRARFNPDSGSFATVSYDGSLRLWGADGQSLSPLLMIPLTHLQGSETLAYSPDGRWVAAGAGDGTVRIWSAHTGREAMGPFRFGDRSLTVVEFSPDGRQLLAASTDGRAWLQPLAPVSSPPSWLPDLAEAVGGLRLEESAYSSPRWPKRAALLAAMQRMIEARAEPDDADLWLRWFLADRGERTINPWSTVTVREQVDRLLLSHQREDVEQALDMDPNNPTCYRRLAELVRPADARRADFLEALARQLEAGAKQPM
ncbi:MAG: protein kinase [Kiritimatiellae bacterium]|nr:protein kinase [Kiritimatiellia bacterium]